MVKKSFIIILGLISFGQSFNSVFGQSGNIVPPTPNAMKMTEYYGQRPNMYTGTANISIPLYSIDFDGWQLPLTLSYSATGVRTNEEAGEVGLGWGLSATGIISRTISGGDDLLKSESDGRRGYVYNEEPVTFIMGYDWRTDATPPNTSYYFKLATEKPDTEPDIFNYNFFGYSGSFVLSQKVADPNLEIKVVKITEDASSILFNESDETFVVITPNGYKGEFTVKEKSTTFSSSVIAADRMTCCSEANIDILQFKNQSGKFRTATSWYLSKITSPNGQVITFTYDLNVDGSSSHLTNSIAFAEQPDSPGGVDVCLQTVQEHVYLKSIASEEVNIDFLMEIREDLRMNSLFTSVASGSHFKVPVPPKRYAEINITGVDINSTLNKSIIFRQSYFNQQYQDRTIGNQSEIELRWLRSRLDRLVIDDREYRFYYEKGDKGVPNKLTTGIDHFGFYNGEDQNGLLFPPGPVAGAFLFSLNGLQDTSKLEYYEQRLERRVNFNNGKAGLLTKVKYPTRGNTVLEYEPHIYVPSPSGYFREKDNSGNMAGGARIKSIKEFDQNDTLLLSKSYRYVEDLNIIPPATPSLPTGKLMTPLLNRYAHIYHDDTPPYEPYDFVFKRASNSSIPGNNSAEGKIIGYSKVYEIVSGQGESYMNVYYFENRPNKVLPYNSVAVGYPNLNGQVKQVSNYNSLGKIVQVTLNQDYHHPIDSIKAIAYQQQTNPDGASMYLSYHAFYTIKRSFNRPFTVITTTFDSQGTSSESIDGHIAFSGILQQTRTKFQYNKNWLLRYKGQLNVAGDSMITRYRRPADYTNPSPTIQHMSLGTVNMVDPVIEEITYKNGVVIAANGNRYHYDGINDKVNLKETYSYNWEKGPFIPSSDAHNFAPPYETKTTFTSYDPISGKLLEYISSDGINHAFVWGYNSKLPVVHGIGIGYNQLLQAHNNASANLSTYETSLRTDSNVTGKQVSTYAHNPLVGISRITDPSGQKKTFEYNQYGRLEVTRDNLGKILTQNKYNFKALSGSKVISLSTSALNFGTFSDCVQRPVPKTLTISNTGDGDVDVSNFSIPSGFSSPWSGGIIYAGTSVDVPIHFIGEGDYSSSISVYSDNAAGTLTATIAGNYIPSGTNREIQMTPNPALSPNAHSTQYVEVKNIGNDCLNITGTTSLAINDPDWSASISPITLGPGQSTTMTVFLKNSNPVTKSFTVHSNKNAGNDLLSVDIQKIILSPTSSSITFPEFTTQTATHTFKVKNTGNTLLDVTSISSNNSKFTFSPASFQLQANAEQTITVTYTSSDFSQQRLDLTFTSNKTAGPDVVTLYAERSEDYQMVWNPSSQVIIRPTDQTNESYLTNVGNVPTTISSVPVTSPPNFTVTYLIYSNVAYVQVNPNTSPVILQPGEALQVSVTSDNFSTGATGSVTLSDSLGNDYFLQLVRSPTP